MSSFRGTNIVNNNLVFGYDAEDKCRRFYKGEPTTNLISDPAPTNSSNYTSHGGNGITGYNPNHSAIEWYVTIYEYWGAYMNMSPEFNNNLDINSYYTISFDWKNNNSYPSDSFDYSLVQDNGADPASGANVLSNSVYIGDGWYRFIYTFIPLNAGVNAAYNRIGAGKREGLIIDLSIKNIQFEKKGHKTQFIAGIRSSTRSLIDLSGKNVIDLSNMSFDSTAHSSDTNVDQTIIQQYDDNYGWIFSLRGSNGSYLQIRNHYNGTSVAYNLSYNVSLNLNTWYFVNATDDGKTVKLYVNGKVVASTSSSIASPYTGNVYIGSFYNTSGMFFNGKIPLIHVNNVALSEKEILQNYNALKSRF